MCRPDDTYIVPPEGYASYMDRILSIYGPYDGDKTMVMSTIGKLLKGESPSCTKGEQMWDFLTLRMQHLL